MVQIYYGYGKGKTSALNGAALRARGAGLKVGVFRFLKGRVTSENAILKQAKIDVMHFHSGEKFVIEMDKSEKINARNVIVQGLKFIAMNYQKYDVICLDEILDLADPTVKFVSEAAISSFINYLRQKCEVIATGHRSYSLIFEQADLVTKMVAQKHYFEKGISARLGFEF